VWFLPIQDMNQRSIRSGKQDRILQTRLGGLSLRPSLRSVGLLRLGFPPVTNVTKV